MDSRPSFYEFFAGGGMARTGLGPGWRCLFANDFDARKGETYRANFGDQDLRVADVWSLSPDDLPGRADLAWASSPCQDLSLAGRRSGLSGARSSAFWGFWKLVEGLKLQDRAPRVIVIENVTGLLTSGRGDDLRALCQALGDQGYRMGALEIDAAGFLPQSRPRLFIVAARAELAAIPSGALPGRHHTPRILQAHAALPQALRQKWVWWRLAAPAIRNADLESVLEPDDQVSWHRPEQTARLLNGLAPPHRRRLCAMRQADGRSVAALFRRTRTEGGLRVQRAELRFDGLAGCLRTPGGGSSRQFVVVSEDGGVRSRLLTPREGARLMGLADIYRLPKAQTAAFHVVGDGVAVPVVRHLAAALIEPLLSSPAAVAAA